MVRADRVFIQGLFKGTLAGCAESFDQGEMKYSLVPMNAEACDLWRYDPPYDFYNLCLDEEDRDEFMNPASWGRELFAVLDREILWAS